MDRHAQQNRGRRALFILDFPFVSNGQAELKHYYLEMSVPLVVPFSRDLVIICRVDNRLPINLVL